MNYINIDQHFLSAFYSLSKNVDFALTNTACSRTLQSNIFAKTKKFSKPFLSVHIGPRSNLLKKIPKISWHRHFKWMRFYSECRFFTLISPACKCYLIAPASVYFLLHSLCSLSVTQDGDARMRFESFFQAVHDESESCKKNAGNTRDFVFILIHLY